MREESSVPAGVLQISDCPASALPLWQTLVNRGKDVYTVLLDELKPSQFLSGIENRLAWFGQRVRVREGDRDEYHAVITGLSPEGGLVLTHGGEETVLCSGSIFPL
jgi:BirA family biotin operon repressor/biotin-[acetyl-CoA-carboxylase] ligase